MSSIPQIIDSGNNVSDFATKFMKRFHLGRLLFNVMPGKWKVFRSWIFFGISSIWCFQTEASICRWKQAHLKGISQKIPSIVSWTMPGLTGIASRHCFQPTSSVALWNRRRMKSGRMCLSSITVCSTVPVQKSGTACQGLWPLLHEIQIQFPYAHSWMVEWQLLCPCQLQPAFCNRRQEPDLRRQALWRPIPYREETPPVTAKSYRCNGGTDPFCTVCRYHCQICAVWQLVLCAEDNLNPKNAGAS